MGQTDICDEEDAAAAAAAAAIPYTVTSVNSGRSNGSFASCNDDDLPRTTSTTTEEAVASPKDEANRKHISKLFTKFLSGYHKPRGKWRMDMKSFPSRLSATCL